MTVDDSGRMIEDDIGHEWEVVMSMMMTDDANVRDLADPVSPLSTPDTGSGTAVLERPQIKEQPLKDDGGDADRYAHYVSKERIAESRLTGRPVVALCGKVWVPKHDPSKYPVCPDCKRIYEEMMN